ncbi:MAG: endonuclease/exonuclease/phosphatase family protein [Pseudomonadota bacterium]|nr:endonuclease/exonuclease/phosphatase family protein [Pseudomonadota bacterium]
MIGRVEVFLRRLRRGLSRSEWLATLLRLPRSEAPPTAPGLVMIQIDGLSHTQLDRALERGEMPFLRRLIAREHYRLHRIYAGVPAATAAFQGELFYGVKGAVAGFSFRDSSSGRLVRMIDPAAAAAVERALDEHGDEALLKDGSCYVDNYTGGAAEPHFCPSASGWGPALRRANPLLVTLLLLSNAYSFLRLGALLAVESVLAIVDCARGLFAREDLVQELKFVPTRVAVSILLRELATIGAKIDIARGLPIIHINFLGYDEQAHRRGPSSLFAHWTLKGIDDAIARLWRAAHRSVHRNYDLWVYSDHGQQEVEPYLSLHGRSIEAAVSAVLAAAGVSAAPVPTTTPHGVQTQRVRQLGGKRIQRLFAVSSAPPDEPDRGHATTTGTGPISFVYCAQALEPAVRDRVAHALVSNANIPAVLIADGPGRARAWSDAGVFELPRQGAGVLGADHPFLEEASRDLVALCHHPDAGDFVLCGWRSGTTACSFAIENGAHGGAGAEETRAFALLPGDAPVPAAARDYLRAADLRQAALHLLSRVETTRTVAPRRRTGQGTLRVMTYNVHSCIGMDGKLSPERIARLISRYAPDVVALQELDVGRARTEGMDQAHLIARYLEMDFHFHPALHIEEERYGDAILTHLPMRLVKAGPLPGLADRPGLEPRGALWVAIDVQGTELQVLNTHLGLLPRERRTQVEALLGPEWLGHPDCRRPVVLCGDFNALPASKVCRRLRTRLNDAQIELDSHRPRSTFFGRFPVARIDHVFVDLGLETVDIEVPDSELVRVASDHLPLIVELGIRQENPASPPRPGDRQAPAAEQRN